MTRYKDIKKLAKNYKKISSILLSVEEVIKGNSWEEKKLEKRKIKTDRRSLLKLRRYIRIYKAIFLKNLECLKGEERYIVKEIYMKGKSTRCFCINNYISETSVYKVLKKFDMYFYYDLLNVSRIIDSLVFICRRKRR